MSEAPALDAATAAALPGRRRAAAIRLSALSALLPAALALLLPLGAVAPAPAGVTVPLLEALLAAGTAAWAVALLRRRELPRLGAGGAALALVGLAIAAGTAGPGDAPTRLHAAVLWLGLAALYSLCARLERGGVTLLLAAVAVSGLVEAVLALGEYAATRGGRKAELAGTVVGERPEGTLGHPNALALFLVLALLPPLALSLLGRGRPRLLAAAVVAVETAAVAVTYSREALLALGLTALGLAAYAGRRALGAAAAGLAAATAAFALADAPFRERLAATASWSRLDPGGFRTTLWGRALHEIARHPLSGIGDFHEVASFGRVPTLATHPHELWLGLAVLYGIPAALAFAVAIWIGVRDALAVAWRRRRDATAAAGVTAALAALLVVGLADYPFWNETLACTTVLLLGSARALRRAGQTQLLTAPPLPARTRTRRLGIVIPTWNAGDDLRACLESIARHGGVDPDAVVVVDNGSTDGSIEAALSALPGAIVLRNAENIGVSRARNQGLAASDGRYVLFLDSDARLTPGAVERLCARLDADPGLALVGPRLEYPGGGLQESPRAVPRIRSLVFGRPPLSRLLGDHWTVREHRLADWSHDRAAEIDYVLGACQLVRVEALAEVGLYDERMVYGPEDADICLRLHEHGWRVLYEPAARVVHRYRRMTVTAPLSRQARSLLAGWMRVLVRHRRRAVPRRLPV